jgi:hypothetical protein
MSVLGGVLHADDDGSTIAITMTNDVVTNEIRVYDTRTHALLQTLPTHGQGGAGGNARGVRQYQGDIVAAVNAGSDTVAVFRRDGDGLRFQQSVTTTSSPVSIDFGNGHMYVAGATSVDSFRVRDGVVEWMDGTTALELFGGGVPPPGSTAQVGVINESQLLVTLKTDPTPGTVDVVTLNNGAIAGAVPNAVSAPGGSLTPFGFSVYPDGTAVITLAHSNQDGLFRDGAFGAVVAAGQSAPCWTTRAGKYVFTANAASRTISRLVGTGSNVFVDSAVAASVPTGGLADLDTDGGILAVIDHATGQSHLSLFRYNAFGELTPNGAAIAVGVPNANGVAIMASARTDN